MMVKTVRIPASLYNALVDAVSRWVYPSQTAGVITSLEHDLDESKITESDMKIIELQDTIKMQLSELNGKYVAIQMLSSELTTAKAASNGYLNVCKEKDTRILDLQKQIDIKDERLRLKDNQIEKLSETMHAQSINIQLYKNCGVLDFFPPTFKL
jgi:uncharacterized protein (DUF3084 family)